MPNNSQSIGLFRHTVSWLWWRVLKRRSQTHLLPWRRMEKYIQRGFRPAVSLRSALAFFIELYSDSALAPTLATFDQAGLDQLMRDLSCHAFLEPGDRPAHMPTRHWWWWLPDDPPA